MSLNGCDLLCSKAVCIDRWDSKVPEFKYRSDVDGLRGISILLVALYHANLGLNGGYVGVDVFFVISGFLITGLILHQRQNQTFRISNFYARRIRRIVPAAFALALTSLSLGFILLLPEDFVGLAKSVICYQIMAGNIFFWRDVGYFAAAAETKPLLHTWSLSVEEQFYLAYPLLLYAFPLRYLRQLKLTILVLFIASLALCWWGTHRYPSATFFLMPTRSWELLLGALLFFIPHSKSEVLNNLISGSGILLILTCAALFSNKTIFPGLMALLPCLGAALIINGGKMQNTHAYRILSSKPLLNLGLLSYSFYLWHWPPIAFYTYWFGTPKSFTEGISLLFIGWIISLVSYRSVERPFRDGQILSKSGRTFCFFVCSIVASTLMGLCVIANAGFPNRIPSRMLPFIASSTKKPDSRDYQTPFVPKQITDLPRIGNRSQTEVIDFIVIGDSHASGLAAEFDRIAKTKNLSGVIACKFGVVPLQSSWKNNQISILHKEDNVDWSDSVIALVNKHHIKNVILIARWQAFQGDRIQYSGPLPTVPSQPNSLASHLTPFQSAFTATVERLEKLGCSVWVFEQVPQQTASPIMALAFASLTYQELPTGIDIESHKLATSELDQILSLLSTGSLRYVRCEPFCFNRGGMSILGNANGSFYKDDNHVSELGARTLFEEPISSVLTEISDQSK